MSEIERDALPDPDIKYNSPSMMPFNILVGPGDYELSRDGEARYPCVSSNSSQTATVLGEGLLK